MFRTNGREGWISALAPRERCFFLLMVATVAWFWTPVATVASLALQPGAYPQHSHILLIPFTSLVVLYRDRHRIFKVMDWAPEFGLPVIAAGLAVSWVTNRLGLSEPVALSLMMLSMVAVCFGAFSLTYGIAAFRRASFGLVLLLFIVPLPPVLLDVVIRLLQKGSAEATALLFDLLAVPVFREGFVFQLPHLTIEVAEQCSGIRSSLALLICSLIAGHLFLHSAWPKTLLFLAVVPLTMVKNAVRIVVLSLLGNYVDPSFVTDSLLHSKGGIPFFLVSLAAMGLMVSLLARVEARTRASSQRSSA